MLVLWAALNGCHPNTAYCDKGVERKRCRLEAEQMHASMERAFQSYGRPLTLVTLFKYLGRILTALEDYYLELVGNLRKVWKKCMWLSRILV